MSNKQFDIENYVLYESYQPEQIEYDEEIDGHFFPDRDEHLKKKEKIREEYKKIKDAIAKKRVRR
jgi:hypothetical protein